MRLTGAAPPAWTTAPAPSTCCRRSRERRGTGRSGPGTAQRVLTVLSYLADADGPVPIRQVADAIGLAPSTTHRLLNPLVDGGLSRHEKAPLGVRPVRPSRRRPERRGASHEGHDRYAGAALRRDGALRAPIAVAEADRLRPAGRRPGWRQRPLRRRSMPVRPAIIRRFAFCRPKSTSLFAARQEIARQCPERGQFSVKARGAGDFPGGGMDLAGRLRCSPEIGHGRELRSEVVLIVGKETRGMTGRERHGVAFEAEVALDGPEGERAVGERAWRFEALRRRPIGGASHGPPSVRGRWRPRRSMLRPARPGGARRARPPRSTFGGARAAREDRGACGRRRCSVGRSRPLRRCRESSGPGAHGDRPPPGGAMRSMIPRGTGRSRRRRSSACARLPRHLRAMPHRAADRHPFRTSPAVARGRVRPSARLGGRGRGSRGSRDLVRPPRSPAASRRFRPKAAGRDPPPAARQDHALHDPERGQWTRCRPARRRSRPRTDATSLSSTRSHISTGRGATTASRATTLRSNAFLATCRASDP